ncbi:MAG: MBL fold metallo-hydrolase [Chloroflexi bacterium]|nr:MBL fold metallo-hydrolase [Chloroflexota bacterium]
MEITWYGLSCFRLTERGLATVVTDPFDESIGLKLPRLKADIVTVSHDAPGHNNLKAVKGEFKALTGPGEYEIGGVFITGISTARKGGQAARNGYTNTLYVCDYGGLSVAHLGDLDHVPGQPEVERLGPVDVALVPVGGGGGLSASQAAEVISLIEPSLVVPMHYKTDASLLKLDALARFLREMGLGGNRPRKRSR